MIITLIRRIVWSSIIVSMVHGYISAQPESSPVQLPDIPKFHFDALSFQSDSSGVSRLDLYVEVPYETVHFTKRDDVFHASYEVTVNIYDTTETLIKEQWWNEHIDTKNYDESISPKIPNLSQKSFQLVPGNYTVSVQMKDNETEKISSLKRKVKVRNYATPAFSISDVMLVNRISAEAEKKVIYPNISGNVGDLSEGFYLFFEAYNGLVADSSNVFVAIRNIKGDIVQSDSFVQELHVKRNSCFHHEKTTSLVAGDYFLDVRAAVQPAKEGEEVRNLVANSSRAFTIRWRGMPVSIVDLDVAIDQLQYLTEKDKIDEIKKAPQDQKRDLFREFWKKKDPTPNTERNEIMEEYYSRVAYADKHFGHYVDGWKTDMGMVYIIFGVPNNVDRHPFDIDAKPYEVWTYYELNREFIFVDQTGFGDYRLQNPIWDLNRTRPR